MKKKEFTDMKRNNKIALRNFTVPNDKHDIAKTLMVRMLRREHPDSKKVPIYTEYDPESPNENYPDIWMRVKNDIYVYEIQSRISLYWQKRMEELYPKELVALVTIDMNKLSDNITEMREQLKEFVY